MQLRAMLASGVMAVCAATASAQMGAMPKGPEVGSMESPSAAVQREVGLLEHEMVPVAKTMPADKYNFAPSQAVFAGSQTTDFATVRTFGQQVVHVAEANFYFYSSLSGLKPDVDMKALQAMQKSPNISKDEAVKMLEDSFAFAHKAVATITPENAFLAIKPVDGMNTRVTLATFGVAHGYDHYGQMVEYLRMNGLKPPQ
jgi:uncharacterized damage-inducible protein DinB